MAAPNRAPLVDPATGMIADAWLNYFANLENGSGLAGFTNVTVTRTGMAGSGGTLQVTMDASSLTGTTLADGVVNSSLTKVGTLLGGATGVGFTLDFSRSSRLGQIGWDNLPTGAGVWIAQPTIIGMLTVNGGIRVLDNIEPQQNFRSNLGKIDAKFLALYCAELFTETLVAQGVMATIGGRVLVGPTTSLTADLAPAATSMTVKHNNLASGHRVRLEANGNIEWMQVTSAASGPAGAYVYSVTRNLDGSGANQWYLGDAVFNTGTTGSGFIDLYSTAGVLSGTGPTIVGNVRFSPNYVDIAPRWAIGNLNGLYGYAVDTYGSAFGDPTGTNITIDATNGFRARHWNGASYDTVIQLDTAGAASFSSGTVTINSTGITVAVNSTTYTPANAYRWSGFATGELGISGVDTGTSRTIYTLAKWSGAGAYECVLSMIADYAPVSGGTAKQASLTVQAGATATVNVSATSFTITARTSASVSSSANYVMSLTNSSATGHGLSISGGATGSHESLVVNDYTGGTTLFRVLGNGQCEVKGALAQKFGGYIYPGSTYSMTDYQTTYYLAAHAIYGIYVNTSVFTAGALLQALNAYVYPGSASGLAAGQTSYYLASHASWGLYTNTNLALAGGVYIGSGQAFSFTGDTDTFMDSDTANRLRFSAGGIHCFWDGGTFFPETDNARDLGHPSFRWKDIYYANSITTSDARQKTDIRSTGLGTDFLLSLRPVDYRLLNGKSIQHGFLAQDVAALGFGGVAYYDGHPIGLSYHQFTAPLVNGFQELEARVRALESRTP